MAKEKIKLEYCDGSTRGLTWISLEDNDMSITQCEIEYKRCYIENLINDSLLSYNSAPRLEIVNWK